LTLQPIEFLTGKLVFFFKYFMGLFQNGYLGGQLLVLPDQHPEIFFIKSDLCPINHTTKIPILKSFKIGEIIVF